jgi:Animal haem peroxidase.
MATKLQLTIFFSLTLTIFFSPGISAPRASSDGTPLPSAREVSVTVHRPVYRDDPKFTVMLAVWGQFMDHDVTATALTKGKYSRPWIIYVGILSENFGRDDGVFNGRLSS